MTTTAEMEVLALMAAMEVLVLLVVIELLATIMTMIRVGNYMKKKLFSM